MSPRSWAARGSGESDVVAADEADEVVAAAAAADDDDDDDDDDDEADDVVAASDEADDVVVAADEAGEVVAADDDEADDVVVADEADEVVVAANEVVAASEANDVVSTDADGAADVTFALPSSRSSPPSPLWESERTSPCPRETILSFPSLKTSTSRLSLKALTFPVASIRSPSCRTVFKLPRSSLEIHTPNPLSIPSNKIRLPRAKPSARTIFPFTDIVFPTCCFETFPGSRASSTTCGGARLVIFKCSAVLIRRLGLSFWNRTVPSTETWSSFSGTRLCSWISLATFE